LILRELVLLGLVPVPAMTIAVLPYINFIALYKIKILYNYLKIKDSVVCVCVCVCVFALVIGAGVWVQKAISTLTLVVNGSNNTFNF